MRLPVRPRRSVLYVPGSNPRALAKARSVPADALILDLEDAVAPEAKEEARRRVVQVLEEGGHGGREILIRVNGEETPWGEPDLAAAARSGADGVLLPKVERADTVRRAEERLAWAGAPSGMALWCMLETPGGILAAREVACASNRIGGLVAGTSDLTNDLGARATPLRLEVMTSLGLILLAARATGLCALDGVHLDLADEKGFEQICRQGRDLGFDGKTLIHPRTVEVANRVFAPDEREILLARRIVTAHAEALARKEAVVVVDGRLVEALHVEGALRLLALAEAIAKRDAVR
ncbi:MAG TPA: CoA ester lyase [Anaeromyxobacteraceae bacterium]|nr:CoA ester lyase [Anaeromyxobacteraceae bacterium]